MYAVYSKKITSPYVMEDGIIMRKGMIIATFHDIEMANDFARLMNGKYAPVPAYDTYDTSGNKVAVDADEDFAEFDVCIIRSETPPLASVDEFWPDQLAKVFPKRVADAWLEEIKNG